MRYQGKRTTGVGGGIRGRGLGVRGGIRGRALGGWVRERERGFRWGGGGVGVGWGGGRGGVLRGTGSEGRGALPTPRIPV